MNIFIPQSIQTQIELEEIADVKRQIISPSSSRTSIGLAQDGLLGAYNLTSPSMRINWRNCMNIISYTSFEKMETKHYVLQRPISGHAFGCSKTVSSLDQGFQKSFLTMVM